MRSWSGSQVDISEDTKRWNLVFGYLDKSFIVDFSRISVHRARRMTCEAPTLAID